MTRHSWIWGPHCDLSVFEVSSFPFFSYEMHRHTEFNLVKIKQTGQMVTEMQTRVPHSISKSSAAQFSVHYTQRISGTDKMSWGQLKIITNL